MNNFHASGSSRKPRKYPRCIITNEPFDTSRRHFRNYEKRPLVQENCPKRYSFSHLYTTGTKREMRKNSIEFFHIPLLLSKRTRDGCHKVRWTLALARPRGALASREIEPKLPSSWVSRSAPHFSDNKKGLPIRKSFLLSKRARDGDRTRDPLLGKEVLHH